MVPGCKALNWGFVECRQTRKERSMTKKKMLRYVGPVALAIGLTGGVLGAGTAGASIASAKSHHVKHEVKKQEHKHKKHTS
jgi:hypothetical protein